MYAVAYCVENFNEVLTQFWEIIVDITTMEIADVFVKFILVSSLLFKP